MAYRWDTEASLDSSTTPRMWSSGDGIVGGIRKVAVVDVDRMMVRVVAVGITAQTVTERNAKREERERHEASDIRRERERGGGARDAMR